MPPPFADRVHAGRQLGRRLADHPGLANPVVLGLPRGGVPVAAEVAAALGAPLDVLVVRKLGVPGHPELAMGAIASGGIRVHNDALVRRLSLSDAVIDELAARERTEVERRERCYRADRAAVPLAGRTVVLVDDGLATGTTMRAAVDAVRTMDPTKVIVAVPVGAPESCRMVGELADELICLRAPTPFRTVSSYYADFRPTTDEQVRRLLGQQALGECGEASS